MKMWTDSYAGKKRTMEEAVRALPKSSAAIMGMAAMETQGFMGNIHKYADHFDKLHILSCLNLNSYEFCENPEYEGIFVNDNWFYGPSSRKTIAAGFTSMVDFIPNNLSYAGAHKIKALKEQGQTIVYWGPATPMNERNGYFNIGLCNIYEKEAIEAADIVVLEVNNNIPYLHGDTQVHIRQVDMVVEYDAELPVLPVGEPSELEQKIAGHVAELVDDGVTIQIGIGGIPNAVALLLSDKKNLGIHTEMFTESMIDLFESGAITNEHKTLWPGKFIFAFALGSRRMYDWLDNNPAVMELRGSYVNNPFIISRNDRMVSLNTALSIDLTGQVCSESIGVLQYSGTGGQLDTHRGAQMAKDGKGIIALRSTAKKGMISTITPMLTQGSKVTIPRQDIDWVVTEFGAVHLQGRTIKERAASLISIAHPDYRSELRAEAKKLNYL